MPNVSNKMPQSKVKFHFDKFDVPCGIYVLSKVVIHVGFINLKTLGRSQRVSHPVNIMADQRLPDLYDEADDLTERRPTYIHTFLIP